MCGACACMTPSKAQHPPRASAATPPHHPPTSQLLRAPRSRLVAGGRPLQMERVGRPAWDGRGGGTRGVRFPRRPPLFGLSALYFDEPPLHFDEPVRALSAAPPLFRACGACAERRGTGRFDPQARRPPTVGSRRVRVPIAPLIGWRGAALLIILRASEHEALLSHGWRVAGCAAAAQRVPQPCGFWFTDGAPARTRSESRRAMQAVPWRRCCGAARRGTGMRTTRVCAQAHTAFAPTIAPRSWRCERGLPTQIGAGR